MGLELAHPLVAAGLSAGEEPEEALMTKSDTNQRRWDAATQGWT